MSLRSKGRLGFECHQDLLRLKPVGRGGASSGAEEHRANIIQGELSCRCAGLNMMRVHPGAG